MTQTEVKPRIELENWPVLEDSPAVKILLLARDYLAEPGHWCKGALRRGDRVCAIGATRMIHTQYQILMEAESLLYRALRGFDSVPTFNDQPKTNLEDVLALFDRAIALGRSRY